MRNYTLSFKDSNKFIIIQPFFSYSSKVDIIYAYFYIQNVKYDGFLVTRVNFSYVKSFSNIV